jgi:hypothetical protein
MSFAEMLLDAYSPSRGGTRSAPGTSVRIDDRQERDVSPGFCQIHVTVLDPDGARVLLELSPVPHNAEVGEVVEEHGGQVTHGPLGATIRLPLGPKDVRRVRDLARAIRRVTRRGQRYPDPNWKWICPRTADSLERFANVLSRAHRRPGK